MYFEAYKSLLYSDSLVPDIFISEYLPSMDGDYIKIYLYILFLNKYNKQISPQDLSKKLEIDKKKINDAFILFESLGLIIKKNNTYVIIDLKEKEITKIFRLKTLSSAEEAIHNTERNIKRNKIISAINDKFFQGIMSPAWYINIDKWFNEYKFDEDVMYTLFQHCYDNNALFINYIGKVAENWHSAGIVNSFDLDKYFIKFQIIKEVKQKIEKKLKLHRALTEYEEEFIKKWIFEFKYDFEVIELALKKTTGKTNPSFNYIDSIISNWHKKALTSKEKIEEFLKTIKKQSNINKKPVNAAIPQHINFEQRDYDENEYDKFYSHAGSE